MIATPRAGSIFRRLERDHEYRPRVVSRCPTYLMRDQARFAGGTSLDMIGEMVDVPRRIVEDVA